MVVTRPCRHILIALLLAVPSLLAAQGRSIRFEADSAGSRTPETATERLVESDEIAGLPIDSVEGALLLRPGITGSGDGISFRGGRPGDYATYLNGVDVTPGLRRVRLGFGTIGLGSATAVSGPLSGTLGNSGSGALLLETAGPGAGRRGSLSFESDRFTGASLGLNRLEGSLRGSTRSAAVIVAATLTGQKAAEFGTDARQLPVFVRAGVDTTVAIPAEPGNPASDTTLFDVPTLAVARGECDAFGASLNTDIAANYDQECTGDRTPASALSGYRLLAASEFRLGRASRLELTNWRARESRRLFSYPDLYNPANLFGQEDESRVYSISLAGPLGERRSEGAFRVGISRQRDQRIVGPLTLAGQASSADPAGGFMLGGLDFRWDFESFPVDSELVANYRANMPGTRRSPYDLENTSQYGLISQYRDDAYAVGRFPESGGPVGALQLFREERTVAFGQASWSVSRNAVFTAGGEYAKYSISNYSHRLTSTAFSDVYRTRPVRGALYAEDRLSYGSLTFVGGVRYDVFSSRAARPFALDTVSTMAGQPNPTFGTYRQFPRISSYTDADGTFTLNGEVLPLVEMREDPRQSSWSPRFRAAYDLGARTTARAGWTRQARMPDLALVYAGLNTDLAITSIESVFGSDIGLETAWLTELGVRQVLGDGTSFDLSGYRRTSDNAPSVGLRRLPDPTQANTPVDLRYLEATGRETTLGFDLLLEHRTSTVAAALSYGFQRIRVDGDGAGGFPAVSAPWERPHTVSAILGYAGDSLRSGFWRGATAWLAFRLSSGLPYHACAPLSLALSDEPCSSPVFGIAGRLPAFRQLDLRLAKALGPGAGAAAVFVDARNLLNFRNTLRVFRATGTVDHEVERTLALSNHQVSLADEGAQNGVLGPGETLDLRFAGQGAGGCAPWTTAGGNPAAPNCIALIRAEQRFGDGDGLYSVEEQRAAAGAHFDAVHAAGLYGAPRRIRLGIEATF